jgi:hypothetical protein
LYKYPKAIIKPEVNQADAFKMLKLPEKIDYFIKGHNCTAIAYGQTGSGKTHTMFGPPSLAKEIRQMNDVDINQESTFPAEWGIFARTILTIFKQMEKLKSSDSSVFYFSATIIEIYFMEVYDLLNEKKKVPTSPHQAGEFDYGKAKEMKIENANDVAKIAQIIMTKRNSRSTSCNDTSSRSHCICTLNLICITNRNGQKTVRRNEFAFADLSGSEKIEKTDHRLDSTAGVEGMCINWDLHQFGKTVLHLADGQRANKRNNTNKPVMKNYSSLLARMLAGSIEGDSLSCMVVCLSQSENSGNESRNSLLFGQNFSRIIPRFPPVQPSVNLEVKLKKAKKRYAENAKAVATVSPLNPFYGKRLATMESLQTEIEFLEAYQ